MKTPALLMMLFSNLLVIVVSGYYFWRVLTTGEAPDSPEEEDTNYPRGG